ncbi:MAG: hypothetical protein B7Z10_04045 [Rhodobacterales bacterium 32-66-7]|nr:MAG: hypothetical protein B7Z10_04045 [Rhodobacterales bacterium 32-66-7]
MIPTICHPAPEPSAPTPLLRCFWRSISGDWPLSWPRKTCSPSSPARFSPKTEGSRNFRRKLLDRGKGPGASPGLVVSAAQIEAVCQQPLRARDDAAPRASGTLESHYAPRAKVRPFGTHL